MSENLQFNVEAINQSSKKMQATADDLVAQVNSLLASVGDPSVLGTNDTLGSVASMLYGLAMDAVKQCVESIQNEYGSHSGKLSEAAKLYQAGEEEFSRASGTMIAE